MNKIKPLLSILIPTKNRYYHLIKLIEYIDSIKITGIEFVIQDNTYNNSCFIKFFEKKNRINIKYFHTSNYLSIADNVDLAIKNSCGEYVSFIGDDDGFMPSIVNCVQWMKDNEVDAAIFDNILFNWPDYYSDVSSRSLSGVLQYDEFSFNVKLLNPIDQLTYIASKGLASLKGLPKLYQGIVLRERLEALYIIGKTYTPGPSPDMATAVALSFIVKKFVKFSVPIIITGQSSTVGGSERKIKYRARDLNDVEFISPEAKIKWSQNLPKIWCTQTVWPESALKAMSYTESSDRIKVSFTHIYARIASNYPLEFFKVFKLAKHKFFFICLCLYYILGTRVYRLAFAIRNSGKNLSYSNRFSNEKKNLSSLEEGVKFIEENFKTFTGVNLNKMLRFDFDLTRD